MSGSTSSEIRVKLLSRVPQRWWLRQLPEDRKWGNCLFLFDKGERDYHWAVVYEDLPSKGRESPSRGMEPLACPRENTLLVTAEPSTIKTYGSGYLAQFRHVLTSQEPWALSHPGRIYSQPALRWFYGVGSHGERGFNDLIHAPVPGKTGVISAMCSNKRQRHTQHSRRFDFVTELADRLPSLEVFGRGVRPIDDKAEAVDPFRYHIAIENHIGLHHWTEKLADAFLGHALPFYFGCPNAADYFPPESFIPIDIHDPDAALHTIEKAIANNEYEKRLPHILEARRRVLEQYNLFAVLSREINDHHQPESKIDDPGVLYARRALALRNPLVWARQIKEKIAVRAAWAARTAGSGNRAS